jgi:hypothetical protein
MNERGGDNGKELGSEKWLLNGWPIRPVIDGVSLNEKQKIHEDEVRSVEGIGMGVNE